MFHAETVSIIAGGSSVKHVNRKLIPGLVIGVNDSFIHANCDVCVSMDRLWVENRWAAVIHEAKPAYIRINAMQNIPDRPPFLTTFTCDNKSVVMSETWEQIDGTNSASCAMNVAYLARPITVYLFGFDMVGDYWYPKYSWAGKKKRGVLSWAKQFDTARDQFRSAGIEVINVSHVTQINSFRKMTPKEFNVRFSGPTQAWIGS